MLTTVSILLLVVAAPPLGERVALSAGQLFIPAGLDAKRASIDLWIHLHGTPTVTEPNFARWRRPGVLVTLTLPGLSSAYVKHFQNPKTFAQLIADAGDALRSRKLPHRWQRICVSSFSAGYGGVRELLKDQATYDRIDALLLADTIYAGYEGDRALRHVNRAQMADFVRFAKDAATGKKQMVLTHCRLQPDGYAGTHETADYILAHVHGERTVPPAAWPSAQMKLEAQFTRGQLAMFSFAGTTGAEHMQHLREIGALWSRLPQ